MPATTKYKDLTRQDAQRVIVKLVERGIWFEITPRLDSTCRISVLEGAWGLLWEVMGSLNVDYSGDQSE